jgi:hypothetical protein
MVERQADPGHVKLTPSSVNRLDEILTAKLDWTGKRSKRLLCDVQRATRVPASAAAEKGAVPQARSAKTKPSFASFKRTS